MSSSMPLSALLASASRACDVASAHPYGFSQRVARTAVHLAEQLSVGELLVADLLLASLLWGAGTAAVAGNVGGVSGKDERPLFRHYAAERVFPQLDRAPRPGETDVRTGIFYRHHLPLAQFPTHSARWIGEAGFPRAGAIAGGMLRHPHSPLGAGDVRVAASILCVAWHMVALRWLSSNPQDTHAERATSLVGDTSWLDALSEDLFEEAVIPAARDLWTEDGFWAEMDAARTRSRIVLDDAQDDEHDEDVPSDAEVTTEQPAVSSVAARAQLLNTYRFSVGELQEVVPDFESSVERLLAPRLGAPHPGDAPLVSRVLGVMGRMVDARTAFDERHTDQVANLARELAILMRCSEADVQGVGLAANVYAVGKLALPTSLLLSPGALDDEQVLMIRETPRITQGILLPLARADAGDWVAAAAGYAERLDGSGYPEGARGAEIPLLARIVSVADTFQALIADRPYRRGHARARALHILQAQSGQLFDGVVTDTLEGLSRGQL